MLTVFMMSCVDTNSSHSPCAVRVLCPDFTYEHVAEAFDRLLVCLKGQPAITAIANRRLVQYGEFYYDQVSSAVYTVGE